EFDRVVTRIEYGNDGLPGATCGTRSGIALSHRLFVHRIRPLFAGRSSLRQIRLSLTSSDIQHLPSIDSADSMTHAQRLGEYPGEPIPFAGRCRGPARSGHAVSVRWPTPMIPDTRRSSCSPGRTTEQRGDLARASREARNDGGQLTRVNRLGHVDVEPCSETSDPVFGTTKRSKGNGGRFPASFGIERSDFSDERVSVLSRHLHIGHKNIWSPLLERTQRLLHRATYPHVSPSLDQYFSDNVNRRGIVVNNQDANTRQ